MRILKKILVIAGIIKKEGKILITQRKKEDFFSLLWEFPGGKIELNETPEGCLKRELFEELNIEANVGNLFCISNYITSDVEIELMVFLVDSFKGEIKVNSHEQIKWINLAEIDNYKFAPADVQVVNELKR